MPSILTGDLYAIFIADELLDILGARGWDPENMVYQHDGAPAHTANVSVAALNATFGSFIGRGGFLNWPARSPDLNPLDYFFWGFMKSIIYDQNPPNNSEELEAKYQQALAKLTPEMIRKSTHEQFVRRLEACIEANGGHFEHLL